VPWVVVQSNPVELGVAVFAEALGPDRVIGAGAYSDTLRFRREIADGLGRRRPQVHGFMVGQHGDHLVPAWSTVAVDGIDADALADWIRGQRRDRPLTGLPDEIRATRDALVAQVGRGEIDEAFRVLAGCPADLRAAVKPFLVHYTAGRTTEMVTAHAVADLIGILTRGTPEVVSVQVALDGAPAGAGLTGVGAIPVTLDRVGWTPAPVVLAADEDAALRAALDAARALRAQMPDRAT
jgi:malate dehydrogenase